MAIKKFSLRWSTYCFLAFLSAIAVYYPLARFGASVLIVLYLFYLLADTWKSYTKIRVAGDAHDIKEAWSMAFAHNSQDFVFLVIAILVGVYVG